MDGQRPGESEKDYMRRMFEENMRQRFERRQDAVEKAMEEEAEIARYRKMDGAWEDDFASLVGGSFSDIQKDFEREPTKFSPPERKAVEEVSKALRKRMFDSNSKRNQRVKKAVKTNKGALKSAKKKSSKGGCAVIALLLLGAFGGAGWGLFEAGHAVIQGLGR